MAIIRSIVGDISGSIRGTTYSRNKGGPYVRGRGGPTGPYSSKQDAVRTLLATLSSAWSSLTSTQRTQWNDYAALNARPNALGDSVFRSGHQLFVGCNLVRALGGLAAVNTPPATAGPAALLTFTPTLTAPSTVSIAYTATPIAAGNKLLVWQTLPGSPGRNPNRRQARMIGISAAAAASPQAFTTVYPAVVAQVSNLWGYIADAQGLLSAPLAARIAWG